MSSAALWPAISTDINRLARANGAQFEQIWLKCDTGMHRLGFMPNEIAPARFASHRAA